MTKGRDSEVAASPARQRGARVSLLEQALWKRLGDAKSLEDFAQAWLTLQCEMIAGVRHGMVAWGTSAGELRAVAAWPESEESSPELAAVADLSAGQRRGVVHKLSAAGSETAAAIGYPLLIDDRLAGVVALVVSVSAESEIGAVMHQLQWGIAGLRDRLRSERPSDRPESGGPAAQALDVLAVVMEQERYAGACRAAVTELAARCDCERVSLGFVDRGYAVVAAVSHSADFGKRMNLVRMLGAAMDEAIDQRTVIRYPASGADGPIINRAHEELALAHGAGTVVSIPVFLGGRCLAAFVYERPAQGPFDQATIDLLTSVSHLLGPLLEEKRQNDRWLIVKARDALRNQLTRLLGPGHLGRKLVLTALLLLTAVGYLATGTYRVVADARIEGSVQRSVIAPFDGFLREAPVRAGETVAEGTLLAALDERDLQLSRLRWVTERAQSQSRFEQALSARERSEVNIIRTEIESAEAQIALIDEQLTRGRIVAPFEGIVVAGDLSQQIGAAVRRGDVLFEIAPLDAYRVILEIDESQIADVEPGQAGSLVTSALSEMPLALRVTRVTPVAQASEGRNRFRVEAELESTSDRLRPGMEGIARVTIGERRLVWIWSRSLSNRLRLWLWRWLPS